MKNFKIGLTVSLTVFLSSVWFWDKSDVKAVTDVPVNYGTSQSPLHIPGSENDISKVLSKIQMTSRTSESQQMTSRTSESQQMTSRTSDSQQMTPRTSESQQKMSRTSQSQQMTSRTSESRQMTSRTSESQQMTSRTSWYDLVTSTAPKIRNKKSWFETFFGDADNAKRVLQTTSETPTIFHLPLTTSRASRINSATSEEISTAPKRRKEKIWYATWFGNENDAPEDAEDQEVAFKGVTTTVSDTSIDDRSKEKDEHQGWLSWFGLGGSDDNDIEDEKVLKEATTLYLTTESSIEGDEDDESWRWLWRLWTTAKWNRETTSAPPAEEKEHRDTYWNFFRSEN